MGNGVSKIGLYLSHPKIEAGFEGQLSLASRQLSFGFRHLSDPSGHLSEGFRQLFGNLRQLSDFFCQLSAVEIFGVRVWG
jgi:hypothetical protein